MVVSIDIPKRKLAPSVSTLKNNRSLPSQIEINFREDKEEIPKQKGKINL